MSTTSTSRRRQNSRSSGCGPGMHRPRAVRQRLAAPETVEDDAKRPGRERVAEQQQMRAAQARGERDGQPARDVAVVDEVVLGHGEALPRPLGGAVDPALQMKQHGALVERELGGVRVRTLDHVRDPARRDVAEAAAHLARGEIADGLVLLLDLLERPLERELVAGRDQQGLRVSRARAAAPAAARGTGGRPTAPRLPRRAYGACRRAGPRR